ncbi:hypothetical protein FKP32DRAFT_565082 [Trametes sanguinea]|nr:hypothetical protein FKP32DRAFT_565082 [Trametes sanguinea]
METAVTDRSTWAPEFLAQFRNDIKVLGLDLPGIQPDKVEIVWASAQIRAVYTIQHRSSCDIVKHFFIRMFSSAHFKEACAKLFIARVLYVEGGITFASDATAIVPSIPDNGAPAAPTPEPFRGPPQASNIPVEPTCQALPAIFHDITNAGVRNASTSHAPNSKVQLQTPQQTNRRIKDGLRSPWWGATHRQRVPVNDMITPTPNACIHLRNPQDGAILNSQPVVRVLVLERADAEARAFVTDGITYADLAFSTLTTNQTPSMEVFVGAAVKLTAMTRLNPPSICPIRVDAFEVVFDIEDNGGDSPPLIARSISNTSSSIMDTDDAGAGFYINDPSPAYYRLQAELNRERKRVQLLEQLLADVCRDIHLPPGRDGSVEQITMDVMAAIADLGDEVARF